MPECTITSKVCLTLLCFIFWVAGAGLLFIGVEVFSTYHHFGQLSLAMYTLVPASIILTVGVLMFILGLVGLIGGCKESKCLLALFFTILLVILVCEIAAGFLGFAYRALVEDAVRTGMNKALQNYTDEETLRDQVDYVQHNLQCCGVTNATDWYNTPWGHDHLGLVPASCCVDQEACKNGTDFMEDLEKQDIFHPGCLTLLKSKFNTYLGVIAGIAFGFALLEILGMICSCILLCRTQRDLPYSELHAAPSGGGVRA